jgi:hypothetical protein
MQGVELVHHRPLGLRLAMAESRALPPNLRGAHMRDWLVPPVLFPIFLLLLVVGYALVRTPT